jgi:hypothetical protein
MNPSNILLKAYYESLYDRLSPLKEHVAERMNQVLSIEIEKRYAGILNKEKYTAYLDTCRAFWDERLEAYNPIGIQCLFDNVRSQEVYELEMQLNWYDSRKEFDDLLELIHRKVDPNMTDKRVRELAEDIIREIGAFPNRSIISAYLDNPSLEKVPDYIVARAIEERLR